MLGAGEEDEEGRRQKRKGGEREWKEKGRGGGGERNPKGRYIEIE